MAALAATVRCKNSTSLSDRFPVVFDEQTTLDAWCTLCSCVDYLFVWKFRWTFLCLLENLTTWWQNDAGERRARKISTVCFWFFRKECKPFCQFSWEHLQHALLYQPQYRHTTYFLRLATLPDWPQRKEWVRRKRQHFSQDVAAHDQSTNANCLCDALKGEAFETRT